MRTLEQWLQAARRRLQGSADNPYADAHILLGHCLQRDHAWLLAHADALLDEGQAGEFMRLVGARQRGTPIAYLTGKREFWSLDFKVTPDTLIPRAQTEHLIEQVLALSLPEQKIDVMDFGAGSGVIAISLAKQYPDWRISALDCSPAALSVAAQNAAAHAVDIEFIEACELAVTAAPQFDLIVSNPPYIAANDPHLNIGDVRFEPRLALVAGDDGLDCISMLIAAAPAHLKPAGHLVLEHGYNQGHAVRQLLRRHGFENIRTFNDLAGHERISVAQKHRHE